MSQRTLVAYASRAGSTAEVAETVGRVLRHHAIDVDVRSVKDVADLAGYDSLVLGSAIWAGKPLPEMMRFLDRQRSAVADLSVAYFILCDTLRSPTPANQQVALGYVRPLRSLKEPLSVGMFAGRRDFSRTNRLLRWLLIHVLHLAEGDWRDWDQIRAWAEMVATQLTGTAPVRHASEAA